MPQGHACALFVNDHDYLLCVQAESDFFATVAPWSEEGLELGGRLGVNMLRSALSEVRARAGVRQAQGQYGRQPGCMAVWAVGLRQVASK